MPRYVNHETDQFWEITLEGNAFTTRFGAVGGEGEDSVKTYADAGRAQAAHDRAIALKEQRGFSLEDGPPKQRTVKPAAAQTGPARNPELETQIARAFDDIQAYSVYGDWLTQHGDVRGELIALQTKRGHAQAAAQLVDDEREHLFGDLHELSEQTLRVTWRNGFIDGVWLERVSGSEDADERSIAELLHAVLQLPVGAFVRELSVGTSDGVDEGEVDYGPIFAMLGRCKPKFLSKISIGTWDKFEVSWTHAGEVGPVWALPALQSFKLRAGTMDLGTIVAPALRDLEIVTGGLEAAQIESLGKAKWPAIERLVVWFGSSSYGATGGIAELGELLANAVGMRKLRHLGLVNAEFTDDICAAIGSAKIVRQLDTLDLSKGTMSSNGVAALVKARANLAHLTELDVSQNFLTDGDVAKLTGICKKVIADGQNEGAERYVTLGE